MNDLTRSLAAEAIDKDPTLAPTFDEFEALQGELAQLLEAMGIRQVMVEIPPQGNADAVLHAHVSGTNR